MVPGGGVGEWEAVKLKKKYRGIMEKRLHLNSSLVNSPYVIDHLTILLYRTV